MYHFIYAVCLVYNIEGEPVNPCIMEASPRHYVTKQQCESEAKLFVIERFRVLSREYPEASIVSHAPCGKKSGANH